MGTLIVALWIAFVGTFNDSMPPGCGTLGDKVAQVESAYQVELTLWEDCSISIDN